jgi:hypothetical protein
LGSVLNDQIGCRRVISLGNRLGISHDFRLLHSASGEKLLVEKQISPACEKLNDGRDLRKLPAKKS